MPVRPALLVLLLGLATACGQRSAGAPPSGADAGSPAAVSAPASVMGSIVGVNVTWGDRYSRGDAAGLASLYSEDAVLMGVMGNVTGRPAIQEYFAHLFQERPDSILRSKTTTETLDVAGPRAYEAGTLILTTGPRAGRGPIVEHTVRYMTFWQQAADGSWLIRASLRPVPGGP